VIEAAKEAVEVGGSVERKKPSGGGKRDGGVDGLLMSLIQVLTFASGIHIEAPTVPTV
jgi:hypothetical protein